MRTVLSAVLALLFFTPANATADEISFRVMQQCCELPVDFGSSVPFSVSAGIHDARRDGMSALDSISASSLELVSGPLLSLVVDPSIERTIYTYGPGTLAITATWNKAPDDVDREGTFVGTVMGFQVLVCEGCDDLYHASFADFLDIDLGPGLFSESFARSLGVGRATGGGHLRLFWLDDVDGGPASGSRVGWASPGYARLHILAEKAVPEPSLLLLGLTFGAVTLARRRRSHASAHR